MLLTERLARVHLDLDDMEKIIEWGQILIAVASEDEWDRNVEVEVPIHQFHDLLFVAQEMRKVLQTEGLLT
jgi:hypothetical protein